MSKKDEKPQEIVLIGSTGFVGSKVANLLTERKIHLLLPSKRELDITNSHSIKQYFLNKRPKVLINLAAFTNIEEAEKQRGKRKALIWKINVEGPKKLARLCKEFQLFFVHISTDSVFPGTEEYPGPYKENDKPPLDLESLSWYSYTKLIGERKVINSGSKYAIIRISYPFGNVKSQKDFMVKTIKYIKSGTSFFSDQIFTPTYIPDLAESIAAIVTLRKKGIFHVTCTSLTSPYKFALYLGKKLGLENKIFKQKLSNYFNKSNSFKRSKYGGLLNKFTQRSLNIKFFSWRKAIEDNLNHEKLYL